MGPLLEMFRPFGLLQYIAGLTILELFAVCCLLYYTTYNCVYICIIYI